MGNKDAFCSGWVPVPVFEKSATEFKLKSKPKLLRYINTVHIATSNVTTLYRMHQIPDLTASAAGHNIDILCIQEHRFYHSKQEIKYQDVGKRWTFVSASVFKNPSMTFLDISHCSRHKIT